MPMITYPDVQLVRRSDETPGLEFVSDETPFNIDIGLLRESYGNGLPIESRFANSSVQGEAWYFETMAVINNSNRAMGLLIESFENGMTKIKIDRARSADLQASSPLFVTSISEAIFSGGGELLGAWSRYQNQDIAFSFGDNPGNNISKGQATYFASRWFKEISSENTPRRPGMISAESFIEIDVDDYREIRSRRVRILSRSDSE